MRWQEPSKLGIREVVKDGPSCSGRAEVRLAAAWACAGLGAWVRLGG